MEHVQRSLSLGLQTILLRGLGTVPGPVVFGIIIDQVGVRWHGQLWSYRGQLSYLKGVEANEEVLVVEN